MNRIRHTVPAIIVFFGIALTCSAAIAQQKPNEGSDLPTVDRVLDRALEAMGGEEAFENIESYHYAATIELAGNSFPAEAYWTNDGKFRLTQGEVDSGQAIMSSDGTTVWQYQPHTGHEFANEDEVERILGTVQLPRIIQWMKETYDAFEMVGRGEFDDTACYAVRMSADGTHTLEAYFDVDTGRILGTKRSVESQLGSVDSIMTFSNWKSHGDVTLFMHATISQSGMSSTMQFHSIEFNSVDESIFELPAMIREMKQRREQQDKD